MSHPVNRGDRRRVRRQKIISRYHKIGWVSCDVCGPALCRCPDRAGHLGVLAKTPVPCSCPMCGNPRRYFGHLTLAERRALHNFHEED